MAQLLPFVTGTLAGGAMGDAVDRRRVLMVTSALLALASGGLALNALAGAHASLLVVYLVTAVAAGLSGVVATAATAAVPSLVAVEQLTPAYATMQVIDQAGMVVGPAVSGLLIATLGLAWLYGIDAITFLWTALFMWRMAAVLPSPLPPTRRALGVGGDGVPAGPPGTPRCLRHRPLRDRLRAAVCSFPRAHTNGLPWRTGNPRHPLRRSSRRSASRFAHLRMVERRAPAGPHHSHRCRKLGGDHRGLRVRTGALGGHYPAGSRRMDRRDLGRTAQHDRVQAAVSEPFRSRISGVQMAVVEGGPRLGDLESGAVATAVSTQFSIVSGGVVCAIGALAVAVLLPGSAGTLGGRTSPERNSMCTACNLAYGQTPRRDSTRPHMESRVE